MQSAPREIQDDLDEDPVTLSEQESAAEAEIKSKEEIGKEARVKAEEEEVAASIREVAHRTKEKTSEEQELTEGGIQPLEADSQATFTPSREDEKEEEATKREKETPFNGQKGNPLVEVSSAAEAKEQMMKYQDTSNKAPLRASQQFGGAINGTSFSSLEVELLFVLGQRSFSIEDLRQLKEEKIISLGGVDFQASVLLQGKKIAEAQLVMVDKVPSLQITKIVEG